MSDWTELLNPVNVLDIVLVAVLIYKLITMVQGTRAVQLIKGILLLLLLSVISKILHLTTVNWILTQVQTMLLVAIPIVFQPELRRALEQIGNSSFIPGNKKNRSDEDAEKIVDQLVPFLTNASRTHTGALIALKREVGLNEYVNTGIKINGILSTQLLGNIFIVNTPLHDGAVIVENHTILAASCYLPLSESRNISKALGTRHRAAIGLSEVSDAIVCIVSEETGAMSIAIGGKLRYNMDEATLRKTLIENLQTEDTRSILQKWRDEYGRRPDTTEKA